MRHYQKRKQILTAFLACAAVAVGGFLVGRAYLASDDPVSASPRPGPSSDADLTPMPTPSNPDDIDTSKPGWALEYLAADKELPRFDQVINGIPVGPTARRTSGVECEAGQARWITIDEAEALDPEFVTQISVIPNGAVVENHKAVECGGMVVSVQADIVIIAGESAGADIQNGANWFDVEHGGQMSVYKTRAVAPGVSSDIAAERWEAIQVNGLPAALGRAILRDEFGPSAVVVWDETRSFQVVVRGIEIELADLLAVAEEALQ